MPREGLDFRRRAQLTELMDSPCSRDELRACLRDLARVNRWSLGYRPLLGWLAVQAPRIRPPLRILDVGCGYGDCLRRVEQWAQTRGIAVELTGLDVNPDTISIAAEADPASNIAWANSDVFAFAPPTPPHFVVCSLFTHHLQDAEVVRFLCWMERHAAVGWFVNDLSRSELPYHAFGVLARILRLHPFVQHDGPVSFARSFAVDDWRRLCAAAGLNTSGVSIRSYRPARLCVARSKQL
jgi:2-polyprenyl-3-methyl-5-hydroxy-6-metoxy-1,4-benzoquinol methylase